MKVKKLIGQNINGFIIVDTHVVTLPSGKRTSKLLLKCSRCNREFERNSGTDLTHVKCKCMCKYHKPERQLYHLIEWQGKQYTQTNFCKLHNINASTFQSRLEKGMSIEEAISNKFNLTCEICGNNFISNRPGKKYCCKTCANRAAKKKGKYKKSHKAKCMVCGKEFETLRDDAKTCSKECRYSMDCIIRKDRYKKMISKGRFDYSVTLKSVYDKFHGKCNYCGKSLNFNGDPKAKDYPTIDHMIPISKGGFHEWDNVQLLCKHCNCKKGNKPVWFVSHELI